MLSRDDILNCSDLKSEIVDVPEWGGQVKVATMTARARDQFEASITRSGGGLDMKNVRAKLAVATLVDDSDQPLFTESDLEGLGQKSCAALDRVFAAAQRLNLITDKDVEGLAKNS